MEAVMKIGGSLSETSRELLALCYELSDLSRKHKIIVVPGGAKFADAVRKYDKMFSLSPKVAHQMAILGMDIYGIMLSNIIPRSKIFRRISSAEEISKTGKLPIFLPSKEMRKNSLLPSSWEVTSDSISAYLATLLGVNKLILVKDVNGIYSKDPKKHLKAKLLDELNADTLSTLVQPTSVDLFLPKLLSEHKLECFVVNGKYPKRIGQILLGKPTICTRIIPS
jgi:aspartokinase-like uncharacterized kinase